MTKLIPNPNFTTTAGDGPGAPGGAPLGTGAMQGNPQSSQYQPNGVQVPGPQVGSAQTNSSVIAPTLIANGSIPLNAQPTNLVNVALGSQSLAALISSGQVSLNQTTYGAGHTTTRDSGPQAQNQALPQAQPTCFPNTITVAAATTYLGD
jgi:hypothetical protein